MPQWDWWTEAASSPTRATSTSTPPRRSRSVRGWSERDWFESLQTVKELERRTGGDVLCGHELERFESLGDGWNV